MCPFVKSGECEIPPCKDCLYYEVCPLGLAIKGKTGICLKFKNKADYVEVVRCGKCKHSNDDGTICRYSVGRTVEPEHYCSYGEKRFKS